jgi:hypothetical protein
MRTTALICLGLALGLAVPPLSAVQDDAATIGVPGRSSQTPWAASVGDVVTVAFGARAPQGASDVFVAVSRDGGRQFSDPVRVNDTPGQARLGGELPPRVALVARPGADPEIVVAYGAKGAAGSTTEIRIARSVDGGRSFSASRALQAAGAAGDRGWHALALDARGNAHVMWLDHRGLAPPAATTARHHPEPAGHHPEPEVHHAERAAIDGVAMAQRSGLYYARDGAEPRAERELVKGVCYCCKVALAATPAGGLIAAWRHVYPGNIRDIAFITSPDGGHSFSAPGRVSVDDWHLAGCPDDGPALAVDGSGTAHVVWPTVLGGPTPEGALFYASSKDGRTFSARVRIPTLGGPKPMHPQVMTAAVGHAYVAWDEVVNGVRQAAVRSLRFDGAGQPIFGATRRLGSPDTHTSYPLLVSTRTGPLAVYVHGKAGESVIRVKPI